MGDLDLEPFSQGAHYASSDAGVSEALRLTQLGASYCEVPPGKAACPFHVHHVEDEMFVILEGSGTYRFGDTRYAVAAGDVLGAPRGGPAYAHKLTNTGDTTLRYLAISSRSDTDVCEYPDSGKFLVASRKSLGFERRFEYIGRKSEGRDYWEGEDSAD
ncbi:cupin domain-containing protein [Marinihelvus fidelis]|nr:cupin domain-containing protein [Marinihelvus fidelis]